MYNRYIPQPDGSFRRSAVAERQPPPKPRQPERPVCPPQPPQPPPPPPVHSNPPQRSKNPPQGNGSIGNFIRQLLPKDFDTSDLLIVLLLLLMAGDCPEDQNNALLTLALYLFM